MNAACKRPWLLSRSLEGLSKVINMQKNMQIKILLCYFVNHILELQKHPNSFMFENGDKSSILY